MGKKKRILLLLLALALLGALVPVVIVYAYTRDMKDLNSLSDYRPNEVSRVYSDDGQLIAQFYTERRTVAPDDKIPKHVKQAFIAAEDGNFYEHTGLDYVGLVRATVRGLLRGGHFRGTSTITQQLVKTMVTGPERSLRRKVREAVLAKQLEEKLTKDEILNIYLNEIIFGRGNYGIEEASRAYFGKSVSDVDIAEAAILGGIPKNPERYNPKGDLDAVKERQKYVLTQMVEKGFITQQVADEAFAKPIAPPKDPYPYLGKAPHFAELVRRQLEQKYGVKELYSGGLTIYTTVDAKLQWAAHQAVRSGLRNVDKRQGYRGPKVRIETDQLLNALPLLDKAFTAQRAALMRYRGVKDDPQRPFVWDLTGMALEDFRQEERIRAGLTLRQLGEADELTGLVDSVDNTANTIVVALGGAKVTIGKDGFSWARKFSPKERTPAPRAPSDVVRRGDLVSVRIDKLSFKAGKLDVTGTLSQDPKVEGSVVAIDPHTHFVRAIVGGESLDGTGLVRAVQSKRQPGSAFKAIVYAAAINSRQITNSYLCNDSPVSITDPDNPKNTWKPQNYESNQYEGDLILRRALAKSKNTCSVRIIEKVGLDETVAMARALGIESELPPNLTIALGSGVVSLLELTNAYTTLAAAGRYGQPQLIRKVVTRQGQVLEENLADPGVAKMDEAVAYITTHLLQGVVDEGTAVKAKELGRALAGKTGTSSDNRDALFVGYSPDLAMGVWVGFDDYSQTLGSETGGSAALPIWVGIMRQAIIDLPPRDFLPPEGEGALSVVNIDLASGLLAEDGAEGSMPLPFLPGTEPSESASQQVRKDFYEQDQ